MNMFSSQGQLNATDFRDTVMQLAKYAEILANNQPSNAFHAGQPSISDEQRDTMLAKAILTQEGKIALAQSMANP